MTSCSAASAGVLVRGSLLVGAAAAASVDVLLVDSGLVVAAFVLVFAPLQYDPLAPP